MPTHPTHTWKNLNPWVQFLRIFALDRLTHWKPVRLEALRVPSFPGIADKTSGSWALMVQWHGDGVPCKLPSKCHHIPTSELAQLVKAWRASGEDLDTCYQLLLVMALLKLPSFEIHRFCREVWRSSVLLKLSRTYTYEQNPFEACLDSKFEGLKWGICCL